MNHNRTYSLLVTLALLALASVVAYYLMNFAHVISHREVGWWHWMARDGYSNQAMRVLLFVLLPLSASGLGLVLSIRTMNPNRSSPRLATLALLTLTPAAIHYLIILTRIIAHREVLWLHWMSRDGYAHFVLRMLIFVLLPLMASGLGLALSIRTRNLSPGLAIVLLGLLVFALWPSFNAYSYWVSVRR